MRVDFGGVDMKVARAEYHVESIGSAIRDFFKDDFKIPQAQGYIDLDKEWQVFCWAGLKPFPAEWGVMLGDAVHNLRSGLDHLMWQLVDACPGDSPGNHTQFPVSDTKAKWRDDIDERCKNRGPPPTHGLSQEAFDFVKSFQPFASGNKGKIGKRIKRLHHISNTDKHRQILANLPYHLSPPKRLELLPRGYFAIDKAKKVFAGTPIKNGTEFVRMKVRLIKFPPEDVRMRVKFEQATNIVFLAGGDRIIGAEDLKEMVNDVRTVVTAAKEVAPGW